MSGPSYHDLFVTVEGQERVAFSSMPFGYSVTCSRTAGWELWRGAGDSARVIAGEFDVVGLRLDVAGHTIVDSLGRAAAGEEIR